MYLQRRLFVMFLNQTRQKQPYTIKSVKAINHFFTLKDRQNKVHNVKK